MVEMRESNKCGGVMTDDAWHQPNLFFPYTDTLNKKKAKNQEMTFYSRKIVPYCLGLRTKEPRARRGRLGT